MSQDSPAISVVMPAYNAQRYLKPAIRSILAQTFTDFEFIIIDDGSVDRTAEIVRSFRDPRIRLLENGQNRGIVDTLNRGLEAAQGRYIARMDADDKAYPQRFARQFAFMEAHPEVAIAGSCVRKIDSFGLPFEREELPTDHDGILAALFVGGGYVIRHPSFLGRTEVIRAIGGYRKEAEWSEDWDLYVRASKAGQLANIPEVLLDYRFHGKSVNASKYKTQVENKVRMLAAVRREYGLPEVDPVSIGWDASKPPKARDHRALATAASYNGFGWTALVHLAMDTLCGRCGLGEKLDRWRQTYRHFVRGRRQRPKEAA